MSIPRLRMFAGPNGSGKSTIKGVLPPELLGVYLNPDEIEKDSRKQGFLDLAVGYRTYLYYIATEDPAINIARVRSRVHLGGHDVPEDKIVSRYARSLDLLLEAVRLSNRAYLFDNSRQGGERLWVAEITDGRDLEMKCDPMPTWFQHAIWDKIHPPSA